MDHPARRRRNLVLGCAGCAALAAAVVAIVLVAVSLLWGGISARAYQDRLLELHARVLEADADEADRERVLERLEGLRDRDRRPPSFLGAMRSLEAMERVVEDGHLSPAEARFLERELARLSAGGRGR